MKFIDSLSYQPVELAFGTSGLRGLVKEMTDLECYINAVGFLRYLITEDRLKKHETIYLAGDLRESTPHIMQVMAAAIEAEELKVVNCGKIPTPAVAYYALLNKSPCIMVTGSHIPADRNGIKFYKRSGEVLKSDEAGLLVEIAKVRHAIYESSSADSKFDNLGRLKKLSNLPIYRPEAERTFVKRFTDFFDSQSLDGRQIVVYQQSAVGRDILVEILEALGAEVVPIERSTKFIPIDTENVTIVEETRFKNFSKKYPKAFAIVSTDGDSDRPFVIDETGVFHRGDILGAIVAKFLNAKSAAIPISSNDAVDEFCEAERIELGHTRIGSPYVIVAMQQAAQQPAVSWEVNGGFLTCSDINKDSRLLKALPTRDATLPIICSLLAASESNLKVSELFAALPKRYTSAALVDNVSDDKMEILRNLAGDITRVQKLANQIFGRTNLGEINKIDATDGLRLIFKSNDIIHIRPSGNAPQVRVYTNADSLARANSLASKAVAAKGYINQLLQILNT